MYFFILDKIVCEMQKFLVNLWLNGSEFTFCFRAYAKKINFWPIMIRVYFRITPIILYKSKSVTFDKPAFYKTARVSEFSVHRIAFHTLPSLLIQIFPILKGPSASAYVTYVNNSDALRAIQSVNNIMIDGRLIKTSLGTTKYCSHFMKNQQCPKGDCMYLHELGDPEASFTKEVSCEITKFVRI